MVGLASHHAYIPSNWNDTGKYWSVFAIGHEFSVSEIKRNNPLFARGFEQVDINKSGLGQIDIERKFKKDYILLRQNFDFFQSKDSKMQNLIGGRVIPPQCAHEVQKALSPNLGVNLNNDGWSALLYRPYASRTPFNHELAIYVTMYYLSNLVRYRPDYLRNILAGEHKWLLDSFIVSSPSQFLHSITCRIVKENYRFGLL